MTYALEDTIAAIASPPGGAARGIVRLSGPSVRECLAACFNATDGQSLDELRAAQVVAGRVRLGAGRGDLPCELYFWPGKKSYTRQLVAEFHTFGSPPLLAALLRRLCEAGARVAEPGEFTLRAFLAGQLDLTQAEAVLGVIDSQNAGQLTTALAQLAGGISAPMTRVRDELLDLLAHLEAGLDFVEEDIEFITAAELDRHLADALDQVRSLADQMAARNEAPPGVRVALIGWPNAGKSSLFNALLGAAGAIVSDVPGTTRDYLTARIDLEGLDCLLVDTAGAEPANDLGGLEEAAQAMTRAQQGQAQVRVLCLDASRPLNDWERAQLVTNEADPQLLVLTKTDQPRESDLARQAIETSSRTGVGLDDLRRALVAAATAAQGHDSGVVPGTAARCQESLRQAAESLAAARDLLAGDAGEEFIAAELRVVLDELGQVVGAIYTDDVLDRIFSRFCIGK